MLFLPLFFGRVYIWKRRFRKKERSKKSLPSWRKLKKTIWPKILGIKVAFFRINEPHLKQADPGSPEAATPGLKYLYIGELNPQKGSWYAQTWLSTIKFSFLTSSLSNRSQSTGGGKHFHLPPRGETMIPSKVHIITSICCPHLRTYSTLGPLLSVWAIIRGVIFQGLRKNRKCGKMKFFYF